MIKINFSFFLLFLSFLSLFIHLSLSQSCVDNDFSVDGGCSIISNSTVVESLINGFPERLGVTSYPDGVCYELLNGGKDCAFMCNWSRYASGGTPATEGVARGIIESDDLSNIRLTHRLTLISNSNRINGGQKNVFFNSPLYHFSEWGITISDFVFGRLYRCPDLAATGSCASFTTPLIFVPGINTQIYRAFLNDGVFSQTREIYFLSGVIDNGDVYGIYALKSVDPAPNQFVIYNTIPANFLCLSIIDSEDILVVGTVDSRIMIFDISDAMNSMPLIDEYTFSTGLDSGTCAYLMNHPDDEFVFYGLFTQTKSISFRLNPVNYTMQNIIEPAALLPNDETTDIVATGTSGADIVTSRIRITGWNNQMLLIDTLSPERTYSVCLQNGYDSPISLGFDDFGFDNSVSQFTQEYYTPQISVDVKKFPALTSNVFFTVIPSRTNVIDLPLWSQNFCGSGNSTYPMDYNQYDAICDIKNPVGDYCCNLGNCTFLGAGSCCREATLCEGESICIGDLPCPPPPVAPPGTVCIPSSGPCEGNGTCLVNGTCTTPEIFPPSYVCDEAISICQNNATCIFGNATCPSKYQEPIGTLCSNSTGPCESNGTCTVNGTCNSEIFPPSHLCSNATVDCQDDSYCIFGNSSCPPNPPDIPGTPCGTIFPDYLCISSQTCNDLGECVGGLPRENGTVCNADGQNCSLSECDSEGVCNVIIDEPCPKPVFPNINNGVLPDTTFVDDDDYDNAPWIIATVIISVLLMLFVILIFVYKYRPNL